MVTRTALVMIAVAVLAAVGGYYAAMFFTATPPVPAGNTASVMEPQDMIGQVRPEFTLADTQGNPVSISSFDDQVVLINFWATWCAPCVEEMPMLSEFHQKYGDEGFQIVGIALDDPQEAADFAAEVAQRWDSAAIRDKIIQSQQTRFALNDAMQAGASEDWDYNPPSDASQQYVRNNSDWSAVAERFRFPKKSFGNQL